MAHRCACPSQYQEAPRDTSRGHPYPSSRRGRACRDLGPALGKRCAVYIGVDCDRDCAVGRQPADDISTFPRHGDGDDDRARREIFLFFCSLGNNLIAKNMMLKRQLQRANNSSNNKRKINRRPTWKQKTERTFIVLKP